ncbi:MAG: FKBP-type peptidyl-prolyl cis-trans isomerase [Deltaproteobacteria bacterium]|nr:MAG: FKBP-type peptidyl-prolyl cis-trans isomerase [Deltaproteobacteria bacterium]
MVGMKAGAARYVHLPQALAYGDTPPPGAPPGDLVAVIELVAMSGTSSPAGTRPRRPPEAPPTVDAFSDLPSGVQIADLVEGDGPKVAQGRLLHVDYTGWTDETHERFDSSYGRPEPFQLKLGTKQVIPGWEIALRDMRVGGRRLVRIPAYLAYGATAQGSIPAHADLLFEIHVVRME